MQPNITRYSSLSGHPPRATRKRGFQTPTVTAMVMVPWEKLYEPQYTDLVSILVQRLRPRAQPIDGSGGDGGRDIVEYTDDNELIIYELKSFTGRLTPSRRRKVGDSLLNAARHQPEAWDLIVPIRPTASETAWFEGLRADFPFVRQFCGMDWLNSHLAQHDDLVRAAIQNDDGYFLERINDMRAEKDLMLDGVPGLRDRYEALMRRGDELSPYYRFDVSRTSEGVMTTVRLKDEHIVPEEPIQLRFAIAEDTPDGPAVTDQLKRALRFGQDLVIKGENLAEFAITAPADLGLSENAKPNLLTMTPNRVGIDPPTEALLVVENTAGLPLASISLHFKERAQGITGFTAYGADPADVLRVQLRVDPQVGEMDVRINPPAGLMTPAMALPGLRVMARARAGTTLRLDTVIRDQHTPLRSVLAQDAQTDNFRAWVEVIADLEELQRRTGTSFPLPADLTENDATAIHDCLRLMRGENISIGQGPVRVGPVAGAKATEAFLEAEPPFSFAAVRDVTLVLSTWNVPLGPCADYLVATSVLNREEAAEKAAAGEPFTVELQVEGDGHVWRVRQDPQSTPPDGAPEAT